MKNLMEAGIALAYNAGALSTLSERRSGGSTLLGILQNKGIAFCLVQIRLSEQVLRPGAALWRFLVNFGSWS